MKNKFLHFSILSILLVLLSCSEEGLIELNQKNQIKYDKSFLKKFDNIIIDNILISWDDYKIRELKYIDKNNNILSDEYCEFKTETKSNITYHGINNSGFIKYSILGKKNNENISEYFVIKFFSETDLNDISYFNINNFTGTIFIFDEKANLKFTFALKDGKVESFKNSNFTKSKSAKSNLATTNFFPPPPGTETCYGEDNFGEPCPGTGGSWVFVTTYTWKDWYQSVNGSSWEYIGSTYHGATTSEVWVPNGSHHHDDYLHVHYSDMGGGGNGLSSQHPHGKSRDIPYRICNYAEFIPIPEDDGEYAYTATLGNVEARFIHYETGEEVSVKWDNWCVTFGSS